MTILKKWRGPLVAAALMVLTVPGLALRLAFNNQDGRKLRFKNGEIQYIFVNGAFFKKQQHLTKAVMSVRGSTNNVGHYTGTYYFFNKNADLEEPFKLESVYRSEFYQDGQGQMAISPDVLRPTARSIPTFPTNDVQPGDSWTAPGELLYEGIVNRRNTVRTPVTVYYRYVGDEEVNGRRYAKILIDYHVIHHPKNNPDIVSFTGFDHDTYYWDIENAAPGFITSDYAYLFILANGETAYYTGSGEAVVDEVSDITNVEKQKIVAELSNTMPKGSGMSVRDVADGIIVNLGNILFDFNKATLKKEFEKRLASVADVLRNYPQIDLAVSGHTDSVGTESYNRILSENRAKTVADFLMKRGIAPTRLSYEGHGFSKPVADNATEEGRQQNRRVEIKLITQE